MKVKLLKQLLEKPVSHNNKILKKVLIENGEIPSLTQLARAVFPQGEVAAKHIHQDLYEVFLVESGTGVIKVNEEEISLKAGTCVTVEPGESHEVTNTGKRELIILILGVIQS